MARPRFPLPARITLALVVVLITTAWNVQRVISSITMANLLAKYAPMPGPAYIGLTGGLSAALGLLILWAFWRRKAWAARLLLTGALGYTAWVWLDRLMLQEQPSSNWPFLAVATAALLTYIAAVALDPRNRYYLGKEAHGRE